MKKSLKIGFPIACVVIVGGTLIALGNLKKQADKINNNVVNEIVSQNVVTNTSSGSGKQNMDGLEDNYNFMRNEAINNKNMVSNRNVVNSNTNSNTNTNTNKVGNTNTNTKTNTSTNRTSTNTSKPKSEESEDIAKVSDKDKAIAMVEEEWGKDGDVYFTNEGSSGGFYIVAVRDKSNTAVKLFYRVDVKNNKIEVDY